MEKNSNSLSRIESWKETNKRKNCADYKKSISATFFLISKKI